MTPASPRLRRIAQSIQAGGVGAYPTEGVWGLGCDPANLHAIDRIITLKGRGAEKGLILIASDITQLNEWVVWPKSSVTRAAIQQSWPGPVTWVVKAAPTASALLTGGRATLAVRVTDHAPAIALCNAAQTALVSTSANRSGHPACLSGWRVQRLFRRSLDWFLPGPLGGQLGPSEIRDADTGQVLRPGIKKDPKH